MVRVDGLAQARHARLGLRADQSRTLEVFVLEHLKTSPCCRRALFCISTVPLFLHVRQESENVTSMNPKNDLRLTPRNYQTLPIVRKKYVNILACCYDSSLRALSKVGRTSGCQIRLPQLLESLVVSVKHTCLMQLKMSEIILCIYLFVHKNDKNTKITLNFYLGVPDFTKQTARPLFSRPISGIFLTTFCVFMMKLIKKDCSVTQC